jgi:hypothetical protein
MVEEPTPEPTINTSAKGSFAASLRDGTAEGTAAMFRAAQLLQRPGVAQTQAILARQYSAGNDEGSALFRLAVARTREIVRQDAEIRRLEALEGRTAAQDQSIVTGKASLETLKAEQVRLQDQPTPIPLQVLSPQTVELNQPGGASSRRRLLQAGGGGRRRLCHRRDPVIGLPSKWRPAAARWRRTSRRSATASSGSRMARR